jgi:thiamine kinase-like enzyme
VTVPAGDDVLDPEYLSGALGATEDWRHGSIRVVAATRIGAEYGLSGRVHRVTAVTARGGSLSFIVKQESAAAVERELLFRSECEEFLRGCIPDLVCGAADAVAQRGVLVLEDVAPATQGDVLHGCTADEADAVLRLLARLHSGSWKAADGVHAPSLPRWKALPMEHDRWSDRLTRAAERFPEVLAPSVASRIRDLPERVADAGDRLGSGPVSWIHVDAHLDNILFRPDGSAVLVDWCNAAIGPPVVDVARFLTEGVVTPRQSERVARHLSVYVEELRNRGVTSAGSGEVERGFALALLPLLQGAVGWAGRKDAELQGRSAALRESFLRNVCAWALPDDSESHKRGKKA